MVLLVGFPAFGELDRVVFVVAEVDVVLHYVFEILCDDWDADVVLVVDDDVEDLGGEDFALNEEDDVWFV